VSRRSNGEGSIYQRKDGTWTATLRLGGQRRYLYGNTRREVAAKLQELQKEAAKGSIAAPSRLTLADYLDQWLTVATPRLRASTAAQYEILIRVHVKPALGGVKLALLRPIHLQHLYSRMMGQGCSGSRARQAHMLLHKALGDAVRLRMLPYTPAADIDPPKRNAPERTIWTPEEVRTFIESASGYSALYDPLWLFLVGSGCRIGEALGLKWSDVDWEASTVLIERAIVHVKNKPEEGPPKTQSGRRRITLPVFAMQALEHQREHQLGEFVFRTRSGSVPQPPYLRRRFQAACSRASLSTMRIHDCRKANASMLVAAGVDVKTVQRRLGHASLSLTLGLYAKAVQAGDGLAAQALDTLAPGKRDQDDTTGSTKG
jgi:integrase